MNRAFAALALFFHGIAVSAAQPPLHDPQVVVIFADVTSSLTIEQNKEVAELTKSVIVHLPPLTIYRVYMIQADPDDKPIKGEIRAADDDEDASVRATEIKQAADEAVAEIEKRYCEVNFARDEGPCHNIRPRPQPDHRSCILEMIEKMSRSLLSDEKRRPVDLIFISDMVEDCDNTPLAGQSIRLIKDDLATDISNIGKFRKLHPVGPRVRVTIVRPHVKGGPVESPVRKLTLEQYWEKAFSRFDVNTKTWWWFDTELPARFVPEAKAN